MKILIVDDQKENIYLLDRLLKGFGHEVVSAADGREALEILRKDNFRMIISDILMPVMDGFQLCSAVREDEKLENTLFVFYTATYVENEDEELALKMGADRFIRKPIDPARFMDMIQKLVREAENGKMKPMKRVIENEKEVFKLYNQRLVNKLEEKMLRLEEEIKERKRMEEELNKYHNQLAELVEERTTELSQINFQLEQEIAERRQMEEALRQNEEKMKAQFKASPIPTFTWQKVGRDFILVNYNNAAETVTRGKISDFVGKTARDMYGDSPEIMEDFSRCFTGKGVIKRELPYRYRTTGRESYLIVTYAFMPPDFILVHTEDITQRKLAEEALKKAHDQLEIRVGERTRELTETNLKLQNEIAEREQVEKALRESEKRYREIFDAIADSLFIADYDGNILEANPAACKTYGYTREELVGFPAARLITPEYHHVFNDFLRELKETGTFFGETIDVRKDGTTFNTEVHGAVIHIKGKEYLLAIIRDVTQRKHAEELLIQSEKMMTVGSLAAGTAHEINNPLAGILQSVQVIMKRLSPEVKANQKAARESGTSLEAVREYLEKRKILDFLDSVKDCGERAAVIVENMLSFTRKSESKFLPHDISGLLDKAISLAESDYNLKKKYDFRHITIRREYAPDLPHVPCEPTEIQQVILNLLKNAAHAVSAPPAPSRPPRIILKTIKEDQDKMVRIEVEDNGPGMPDHIRRRVFEPFFTTKQVGTGTGLGLSVSYFIITQNHGGAMEVKSKPGQGTTFIIRLPMSRKRK